MFPAQTPCVNFHHYDFHSFDRKYFTYFDGPLTHISYCLLHDIVLDFHDWYSSKFSLFRHIWARDTKPSTMQFDVSPTNIYMYVFQNLIYIITQLKANFIVSHAKILFVLQLGTVIGFPTTHTIKRSRIQYNAIITRLVCLFMSSKSDLCSAAAIALLNVISWYIASR